MWFWLRFLRLLRLFLRDYKRGTLGATYHLHLRALLELVTICLDQQKAKTKLRDRQMERMIRNLKRVLRGPTGPLKRRHLIKVLSILEDRQRLNRSRLT